MRSPTCNGRASKRRWPRTDSNGTPVAQRAPKIWSRSWRVAEDNTGFRRIGESRRSSRATRGKHTAYGGEFAFTASARGGVLQSDVRWHRAHTRSHQLELYLIAADRPWAHVSSRPE